MLPELSKIPSQEFLVTQHTWTEPNQPILRSWGQGVTVALPRYYARLVSSWSDFQILKHVSSMFAEKEEDL